MCFGLQDYLLGLCSAFKCQPFEDMMSFTSKISNALEPNATIVISGFPMTNSSWISLTLQITIVKAVSIETTEEGKKVKKYYKPFL